MDLADKAETLTGKMPRKKTEEIIFPPMNIYDEDMYYMEFQDWSGENYIRW